MLHKWTQLSRSRGWKKLVIDVSLYHNKKEGKAVIGGFVSSIQHTYFVAISLQQSPLILLLVHEKEALWWCLWYFFNIFIAFVITAYFVIRIWRLIGTAIIGIREELKAVLWRFGLPEFDFLAKVLLINLRKSASSDSFLDVISDGAFWRMKALVCFGWRCPPSVELLLEVHS